MGIISSLLNSFMLPRKKAVLNINKLNIGSSVTYFILLLFLVTLPDLIKLLINYNDQFGEMPRSVFFIQIVVFYPLQIIFLGLITITSIAVIGLVLNKLLERKLRFALLWKMAIHASTIPLFLYALINNLYSVNTYISVFLILILFFILYKIILVFPKPKNK
ncbi:DUF1189 domain-containing protein [Neobacillus sedimentimangrovi]|uniref:DUF1189 domain-containing protein n=1 Tax=Neobacillus sedimentimangrovi TaxID=2699460 RepID=A0ABS8QHB9_9BACI|nr:DUF1189 family protein [Neobacillus sedimentimangrovi]MCD4838658.1 DUF1189 domain-containing protein [Neobacillus sedimentimangrovi]